MKIGGIGLPELLIILAVILLIFGPKNLPKLGSAIGKTVKNLREGMNSAPDIEMDEEDSKSEDGEDADGKKENRKVVKRKKKSSKKNDDSEKEAEKEEAEEAEAEDEEDEEE